MSPKKQVLVFLLTCHALLLFPGCRKATAPVEAEQLAAALKRHRTAQAVFQEARVWAMHMDEPSTRGNMLYLICNAQAQAALFGDAIQTAQLAEDYRDWCLGAAARAQAKDGQLKAARETLRGCQCQANPYLAEIASIQAERGDEAGALAEAARLGKEAREEVLQGIAYRRAEAGDLQAAWKALESIREPLRLDTVRVTIARTQARNGDVAGARATAARVKDKKLASMIGIFFVSDRISHGDLAGARLLAGDLRPEERPGVLLAIASQEFKAGERASALETLRQAQVAAASLRDVLVRGRFLAQLVVDQQRAGMDVDPLKVLEVLPNQREKKEAFCMLARTQAARGDVPASFESAKKVDSDPSCALQEIALAQASAGRAQEALQTIRGLRKPADVAPAIKEIVSELAEAGKYAEARTLAGGIPLAGSYSEEEGYDPPLSRAVANAQTAAGDVAGALAWARSMQTPEPRAAALLGVAQALATAQKAKH